MDFAYTAEDEAFRDELTGGSTSTCRSSSPSGPRTTRGEADDRRGSGGIMSQMERRRAWQRKLNEGRWAAITWPAEWGGRDATVTQNVIYSEAMARYRTPGIYNANGLWQIGPMIIRWGTDEQKDRWIPNILERRRPLVPGLQRARRPAATSPTCARSPSRDGDDYVLNGQKIWISSAHIAKWGLFLVRTDPDAIAEGRKHEGITALIIDLEAPGIDIRPIRDIAGEEMFCEVFFDRRAGAGGVPARRRGRGLAGRDGHARLRAGRHRRASPSACGPTSTRWSASPAR